MERFTNAAFSFEVTDTAAAGGDGPHGVAILLHGFPQDRRCWDRVTSVLAGGGYRVLAPDLRGYSPGARPAGRSAYRNSQLAADVLALADAAGAERFHLAGHDWGAALAWYVAGRCSSGVTAIGSYRGPRPSCAGTTSPGPIASPNSTAPRTGCPNRPPIGWRRCSRSTSRRRPDRWACRALPVMVKACAAALP